jgi:hypothetical protein
LKWMISTNRNDPQYWITSINLVWSVIVVSWISITINNIETEWKWSCVEMKRPPNNKLLEASNRKCIHD